MEEIIPLIFHGCKLARDLESNLPNFANQPNILWKSCDEIIRIFSNTRDRLNAHMSRGDQSHEWQPMDLVLHTQPLGAFDHVHGLSESGFSVEGEQQEVGFLDGREMEGAAWSRGNDSGEVQPVDVSDSARSSSLQRQRRRNDDADKRIVRVPAPLMGNTEIPPEDGYTWRKYGQKEILCSRFPRAYYRCTHQKLYQCPAKKQVQRLNHDPFTFEVKYRGNHTCTVSSTAPSVPPATIEITPDMTQQATTSQLPPSSSPPPPSTSVPLSHWLSMDIRQTGASNAFVDMHMYRNFGLGGSSGSEGAGPSTIRFERDSEYYQPVVDFADVMFNPGSSNTSMDEVFSAVEDKWDNTEDKKS